MWGGGGGRILLAATLDVNNFFLILKQTLPNLATFSKNYLGTIWYDRWLSTWLDVSMATIFWQACFSKFQSLLGQKLKKSFLVAFLKFFDHFLMFLFVWITFDSILGDLWRFWTNPEIQDCGRRWIPFRNDYTIITSCDVIASWCGRQRRHF